MVLFENKYYYNPNFYYKIMKKFRFYKKNKRLTKAVKITFKFKKLEKKNKY